MSYQLAPLLVALVFTLTLLPPAGAADLDDLDALSWLTGCWQGQGGGGKNQECWMAPEGGLMLAVSRVISERGSHFEFLRIASVGDGDGLALLAQPSGKPASAFPLIESSEGHAVFANPEHDFPQRIIYRRDGDAMTARVEALRDDKWEGFDIAWQRVADSWPVSPSPSDADLQQ